MVIGIGYAAVIIFLCLAALAGGAFVIAFVAWCIRESFKKPER